MNKPQKNSLIRARVTAEMQRKVVDFAQKQGLDMSDIIRLALQKYMNSTTTVNG